MLRRLTIRDFVIVDRLELEFEAGFSVLTGETGAGKSILIDALSLALGERAESGVVRAGCERAEVSAEFDLHAAANVRDWLEANALSDGGACLLRRVIDAAGRSRAFINATPTNLQQLRELGEMLVDIHGQHAHQSLAKADVQRALLDGYGGHGGLAAQVREAHAAWQQLRRAREDWQANAGAVERERSGLEEQQRDLQQLAFSAESWQTLQEEHKRLSHASALLQGAEQALQRLADAEDASLNGLHATLTRLRELSEYDNRIAEVAQLLEPAATQVQEAVYELRRYRDRLELDPARLQQIETNMDQVHRCARKYRVAIDALPVLLQQTEARLAQLGSAQSVDELLAQEQAAAARYQQCGKQLSSARAESAKRLSSAVTKAMQSLAMEGGSLSVALEALTEGSAHGLEQIEFRVSAHKGLPAGALNKVASGGELSRVSLALQVVLAKLGQVPTMIFDEVDAGIGGRVAEVVGRLLKQLGRERQVLCVTHLPQVAACGDQHFSVAKRESKGAVTSSITALDEPMRVNELARMLGGAKITETTRKHAAELLAAQS